jgi:transcriptional regulator with XRE-family HTH domain
MALRIGRSRLPELLKKKRMSQAEFSRRIDVTEGFVSQVIKGEAQFSLLTGKRAANLFGCYIDDLVEWLED